MRRLSHVVATVTSVATMTLAAGCGGDNPTPSAAPTKAPSTPSSPSPTASVGVAPTAPPNSDDNSRTGAATFVEYYVETLNYASVTGDLEPASTLTLPGCRSCNRIARSIRDVYENDGEVQGGAWTPNPRTAVKTRGGYVIDVEISFAPQTIIRSKGGAAQRYEGGRGTASFTVVRDGGGWKVQQWSRA